ncbi:sulfatase-like hydrolase/transferase [uncultured Algibacter sp.]|uniref:sulfatase n=1 Tax=uncultured Algibacter sp. TaxID=298659 RepID=UPI0026123D45|nr:sulfatase-like hydrolase/transferase [uncultured Algibacter sp.]
MNKYYCLLCFLCFHATSFSCVITSAYNLNKTVFENEIQDVLKDIVSSEELITKEIVYNAPKSGEINFCWYSEGYTNADIISWNKGAKVFKNLLYMPMSKNIKGEFMTSITMPKNSNISYGFWILKDASGVYQDLWDWHKNRINFDNNQQTRFQAVYTQNKSSKTSLLVPIGWLIFLTLLFLLLILNFSKRLFFKTFENPSIIRKVILLGIALFLFHIIARSEIIKLHPKTLFYDLSKVTILFKASFSDFVYVLFVVLIGVIPLFFIQNKTYQNVIFKVFQVIIFLSAFFAFTNISTVILLGQPFNYEWFYYADFLGSEDALNALKENVTLIVFFNLLAISISVFLLAKILDYAVRFIAGNNYLKYSIGILVFVALVFLVISSLKIDRKYANGKVENAVLAMVTSIIANKKTNSLLYQNSGTNEIFKPNEGTPLNPIKHYRTKVVKNVIYIILESSGAKYFDAYGANYNITPNLNAYAEKALLFKNAYAHAPATMKSMVALLGSIYPHVSYKCLTYEKPDFSHPTISSLLKEQGYNTSFFTSADLSYLKGKQFLDHRNFDTIEDFSKISCNRNFKQEIYKEGDAIDDLCLTNRFETWLENNNDAPFFSTIWTVQGHYPYFFSSEEEDFHVDNLYLNRYLNTIKQCDRMIGDIIAILKEKQLFESTLIVVTGDHGEAFNQHNNHGHASTIYEENVKIPLYFINPLFFNGEQREDMVSMKDIASTTLSLLDIVTPPTWQGRDVVSTTQDEAFFFTTLSDYLFGYRKGNKKFIFNETSQTVEVFDLLNDPDEKVNISDRIPEPEISQAKRRVASWIQYQVKFVNKDLLN